MLDITKVSEYPKVLVKGLLENRYDLKEIVGMHRTTDVLPIMDFERAIETARLTYDERRVLAVRFGREPYDFTKESEIVQQLGLSRRTYKRLVFNCIAKIEKEMNGGLANV